jgi:protein phosphatase 1 regulatory subunit 37
MQTKIDIAIRARACITQLTSIVSPSPPVSTPTSTPSPSAISRTPTPANMKDLLAKANSLIAELTALIPALDNPERMQELLGLNDQLTTLLEAVPPAPAPVRPVLTPLRGLGLGLSVTIDGEVKASEGNGVHGIPNGNGVIVVNGDGEVDDTPTTPRVDKGKAKAESPPEEPEKVLSPTFMLAEESDDEDEDREGRHFVMAEEGLEGSTSPNHR